MLATAAVLFGAASLAAAQGSPTWPEGVEGTGTMGVTNPTAPVENTKVNQTSDSRLLSLNSIDDFCIFAPPYMTPIAESETFEVAWCTKPRNNARLIPDGTLTGVSFIKTDSYVQIMGYGNFTNINIPQGDWGGELDPHGAYGAGNPIGGNVTVEVDGKGTLHVGEWMQFISYQQFCLRACTNANSTYSAATMCEHKLDEVGCNFVMPGNYNFNGTFETCEADVAYPPGLYPTATVNGTPQFSTFAQYFTGVYSVNGSPVSYTVGTTVTPSGAYSTPSSSNCKTVSTISNGQNLVASGVAPFSGAEGTGTAIAFATGGAGSGSGSSGSGSGASASGKGASAGTTGAAASGGSGGSAAGASKTGDSSSAVAIFPGGGALVGLTLASVMSVAAGVVMML